MTPEKPSHNLEVVSSTNASSQDHDSAVSERRRVPRLNLTREQFRHAQNGKIFSVADLSPGGMALRILDRSDLILFTVGASIEGVLNLSREKLYIRAKVRHVGGDLIGCEFEALDGTVAESLKRFLDPAVLGQELKPIPAGESGALWYHGPSGTDILLWRGLDGSYRKISVFVLGSFVQWEEGVGVSTGRAHASFEQSEVRGVVRFETMLLVKDSQPETGKLSVAKTLILSSNLPQDLKKWCSRQLEV